MKQVKWTKQVKSKPTDTCELKVSSFFFTDGARNFARVNSTEQSFKKLFAQHNASKKIKYKYVCMHVAYEK